MKTLFSLLLLIIHTCCAQPYFPLAQGNRWDFRDTTWSWGGGGGTSFSHLRVLGDSTLPNGRKYSVLDSRHLRGKFVRVDTNAIYFFNERDSNDVGVFRLQAIQGERWNIRWGSFFFVTQGIIGTEEVFGVNTVLRLYHLDGLEVTIVVLSDRFGPLLVWDQYDPPGSSNTYRSVIGCVVSDTTYGTLVSVRPQDNLVVGFSLLQNYPNPFNPTTTIRFSIPQSENVMLKVFSVLGEEVATLVNEKLSAGNHQRTFEAIGLTSGVYFYQLKAGAFVETKKLIYLR